MAARASQGLPGRTAALLAATCLAAAGSASAQGFKLNRPFPRLTIGSVYGFQVVPGSDRVLYLGDQEYTSELYSVRVDGSEDPIRLSDPLAPDGSTPSTVSRYTATPDGSRVVFLRKASAGVELLAVPVAGGPLVFLAGPYPEASFRGFVISPDSRQVVFFVYQVVMYSVPVDGSAPPRLLGSREVLYSYRIGADSTRMAFVGRFSFPAEAFSVPLDGSTWPVRLSPPIVSGGNVSGLFQLTPDGSRMIFYGDLEVNDRYELFGAPIDASAPAVKLNDPLPAGGQVSGNFQAGAGNRAVYIADQELDDRLELYSVPADGSSVPVKLNGPLVAGGDVSTFLVAPDGQKVVYAADELLDDKAELFSAPVDASAPAIALNVAQPTLFEISPDSTRAVLMKTDLFSVPLDASAPPVQLNGPLVTGGAVQSFRFSTDRTRVIYAADELTDGFVDLFSVPAAGGQASIHLTGDLPPRANVGAYGTSADGARVLYWPTSRTTTTPSCAASRRTAASRASP